MHVRELIELGLLVTRHGPLLIHHHDPIPDECLERYWSSSKCRLERWQRALKRFEKESQAITAGPRKNARWQAVKPHLEEILLSELLTRVWTALVCAVDRVRGVKDAEPIVRNILNGHLEARNRALNLLVYSNGIAIEESVALNRLRRRVERWTDLLVGHLVIHHDVREFAFDTSRAADFAHDMRAEAISPAGHAWQLTQTSLRAAFLTAANDARQNLDLNGAIASSILLSFRAEQFDSTGLFRSLWLERLSVAARDSQGMIEDLLAMDNLATARPNDDNAMPGNPFSSRWN